MKGHDEPGEGDDGEAFFGVNIRLFIARAYKKGRRRERDERERGDQETPIGRLPVDGGDDQRQEKHDCFRYEHFTENFCDGFPVHRILSI